MQKLGSLFWGSVTSLALLGIVTNIAAPIAFASPIVKIDQPGHEQVVQGKIIIDVSYRSDSDQPITRLDLLIDGELARQHPLAVPRTSGKQSFEWDFTSLAGSKLSLSARAVDAKGEVGMATISVTVAAAQTGGSGGQDRIPPVVNIYYPAQGAELSGEVEVRVEANDNVGVKYVIFFIDGKMHKLIMNTGPYVDLWDTTRTPDGPHVLQVKAGDEAENEGASAEVTIFVRNHDMTAAPSGSLTPAPLAPTMQPPAVGVQQPEVASTGFGPTSEPMMAMASGAVDVQGSRVGYASPISEAAVSPRMSAPSRTLGMAGGALELDAQRQAAQALAVATASEPANDLMIASTDVSPRMTTPRRLEATSSHVVTPIPQRVGDSEPIGPQMAAADVAPRMTMPRTVIDGMPRTATVQLRPGWVVLDPILQVTPDTDWLAARTTVPGRSLMPTEQLAADEPGLETLVVAREPQTQFGPVVARIDGRITQPDRMLDPMATVPQISVPAPDVAPMGPAELSAFRPIQGDTGAMRIAVLPERALRAAIPADGRMTLPGQPMIAPVASMQFADVKVLFDSETLELLAAPELNEGISIAPLREIFEASDGVLYWYPVEKRVTASRPGTEMSLTIGDPRVTVNDQMRVLEVAPYIKHGRTMVPLQFLADTLDVTVTFNPATGQICLTSNEF